MINDIINSIKVHLYERATSPIFLSFSVSWVAWNYKLLMVISSNTPIESKLNIITNTLLYMGFEGYFFKWIVLPLLSSLSFIVVYPLLSVPVYKYWLMMQNWIQEIRKKSDDKKPLTREEENKLREQFRKLHLEYERQVNSLETSIKFLKEDKESLQKQIEQIEVTNQEKLERAMASILKKEEVSDGIDKNSEKEAQEDIESKDIGLDINDKEEDLYFGILEYLGDRQSSQLKTDVFNSFRNASQEKFESILESLEKDGLINTSPPNDKGTQRITIIKAGKNLLITKGIYVR